MADLDNEKLEMLPKGLRSAQKPSPYGYLSDDAFVLLEYKGEGSDKFYGAFPDEGGWVVFWGRNGKRPQQSQRVDRWEAQRRVEEKLAKGYSASGTPQRLTNAFLSAPEWFGNIRDLSPHFTSLMERAAMMLNIQQAAVDTEAAKRHAEKRRNFRL